MRFCARCGDALSELMLPNDDRPRMVCPACGHVAYENPKPVVGALPVVDGKVLLLRRGIEPRIGKWTCPGGFLEIDETVEEGALREAMEELGITVGGLRLLGVYSGPSGGVVVVVYLAQLLSGRPRPSHEAIESAFFAPQEIPWEDLAFPTTVSALRDWVSLAGGRHGFPVTPSAGAARQGSQ